MYKRVTGLNPDLPDSGNPETRTGQGFRPEPFDGPPIVVKVHLIP